MLLILSHKQNLFHLIFAVYYDLQYLIVVLHSNIMHLNCFPVPLREKEKKWSQNREELFMCCTLIILARYRSDGSQRLHSSNASTWSRNFPTNGAIALIPSSPPILHDLKANHLSSITNNWIKTYVYIRRKNLPDVDAARALPSKAIKLAVKSMDSKESISNLSHFDTNSNNSLNSLKPLELNAETVLLWLTLAPELRFISILRISFAAYFKKIRQQDSLEPYTHLFGIE